MNYREKMRKAVSSPWDGSAISYGEWGALRPDQRELILRLLDEMDSADNYIKRLYLEKENYANKVNKARSKLESMFANENSNKITDDLLELYNILDRGEE